MNKVLAHLKSKAGFTFARKSSRSRQRGFTLIELVIAIVIVVTLTTIGVASFNSASQANAVQQQAQELKTLARKLRTDASAAIKTPGDCQTSGEVYGTYMYFKQATSDYYYGIACLNPSTNELYSPMSHENLKTPLTFDFSGGANDNMALLYTFEGDVITYIFNLAGDPLITTNDFTAPKLSGTTNIKITDGTSPRDYRINFSATGLVCEEKASIASFCAVP